MALLSQPLSSSIHGLMNEAAVMEGMEVVEHGLGTIYFYSPRPVIYGHC